MIYDLRYDDSVKKISNSNATLHNFYYYLCGVSVVVLNMADIIPYVLCDEVLNYDFSFSLLQYRVSYTYNIIPYDTVSMIRDFHTDEQSIKYKTEFYVCKN